MVFKFDEEQYSLVKKYVKPQYMGKDELVFDDLDMTVTVKEDKKVEFDDVDEFQSAADEAIICYGMVNEDYLSDLGCKLQWLYDEIYYQTKNQK